jgi:hypothetical protein
MQDRLFHYTTASRLRLILECELIKVATAGVHPGERPAVWFSSNPDWEPTATKLLQDPETGAVRKLSFFEMAKLDTPVRIEIAPRAAPYTWEAFTQLSGCSRKMLKSLEKAALEVGAAPSQWRVSFAPVGCDDWLAVEIWMDGEWSPILAP